MVLSPLKLFSSSKLFLFSLKLVYLSQLLLLSLSLIPSSQLFPVPFDLLPPPEQLLGLVELFFNPLLFCVSSQLFISVLKPVVVA